MHVGAYYTQASHRFLTASNKHHMITLLHLFAHLRLYATSEKLYYLQFFFTIKANPKNETGLK